MTNDTMLGGLYLLMAVMLVLGIADGAARAGSEDADDGAGLDRRSSAPGFVLFTFRDNFGWVAQRLKAEAVGTPVAARHAKRASRWRSTAISGSTRRSMAET